MAFSHFHDTTVNNSGLSIVLLISNVIAIKIDLTTNSTITQHIMIVYRFIC